jgi:hypothetical protein
MSDSNEDDLSRFATASCAEQVPLRHKYSLFFVPISSATDVLIFCSQCRDGLPTSM